MIRKGLVASVILVVVMLGLSLWAMPHLPANGQFATHWNLSGQADRFGSRHMVLWFMPALGAGLAALLAVLPFLDPRRGNLLRSSLPYLVSWIGAFVVLAFAHSMMVLNAAGLVNLADVTNGPGLLRWIAVLVGAFITVLGSVMGKIRPNWFLGVRTPWTLSSDLSWDKTHRLAGWLFMLTGIATVITALAMIPRWALVALAGGSAFSIIAAVVYSFLVWKSDPSRETLVPEETD